MKFARSSGVLLHVTSLPSSYGIGDLGEAAFRFVDFLHRAGQSIWQVLPLGPTAKGNSPYSSYSAFAGNPLLIDLVDLVHQGLLDETDLTDARFELSSRVDFPEVRNRKLPLLMQAFARFDRAEKEYVEFCHENEWWLQDFARFAALRDHFGHADWTRWDTELVHRDGAALGQWDQQLHESIAYAKFLQFVFYSQWKKLKDYANHRGVLIFGDMPIFVAHESADVWANQELFYLNEQSGRQTVVAGVPPDYFSETGQRWGNPLYRWDRLAETNYDWWTKRFQLAFEHFDLMRIDHFRGFESYWEVPAESETAINGQWQAGPGAAPFLAAREALGDLPIIAEDLGLITDEVHQLRDNLEFPGMRVFQFGFDVEHDPYHRPEAYPECSAVYTGTHDNETIMGWYDRRKSTREEDRLLDDVIPPETSQPHWEMIRAVFDTPAAIAIVPMQDLLGLGNDARMNVPGEPDGNWSWRCQGDDLSDAVASSLEEVTETTQRRSPVVAECTP